MTCAAELAVLPTRRVLSDFEVLLSGMHCVYMAIVKAPSSLTCCRIEMHCTKFNLKQRCGWTAYCFNNSLEVNGSISPPSAQNIHLHECSKGNHWSTQSVELSSGIWTLRQFHSLPNRKGAYHHTMAALIVNTLIWCFWLLTMTPESFINQSPRHNPCFYALWLIVIWMLCL